MIRILSLAAFLASPAAAQDLSVDAATVRACFADTATGERTPHCLGAASNACQEAPGGATTPGIAACIAAETAVWDAILNEEYRATRDAFQGRPATGGSALTDSLRAAQGAWIAFRDADCALAYDRWADGTLRSVVAANCLMVFTADRAVELRDMREGG